jgi:hypothetical protein
MPEKPDPHLPIGDKHGARVLKRLYAMTEDEAIEETLKYCEKDHPSEARFPVQRWMAAQQFKELHTHFKTGTKAAILEALHLCTLNDLPIPRWCAMGYLAAFRKVVHYRAKSWDDVFGRPHPKRMQLEAKRRRREKGPAVYNRITDIKKMDPDTPIDAGLFESVGKEFGLCKTLTEEYYYEMVHWLEKYKSF